MLKAVLSLAAAGTLFFAADASAAPLYPQCPPVGNNQGCSQLIVVAADGTVTVQTDPNAPPAGYDGAEDTLIGLQNNSKHAVASINLASPSKSIFGFDGDGLCNPSQWPSAPAVTPPNCPGTQGFGTTGYEGPNTSFSNISPNELTGTVNFTQPIAPGGTTYWALEEALQGGQLRSAPGGQPIAGPVSVVANVVNFDLTCVGSASCSGAAQIVVLERLKGGKITGVSAARRRVRTRRVVVGSVPVALAPGQTSTLAVKLNRAGRALLSKVGSFPGELTVALKASGTTQVTRISKVRFKGHRRHR